MGIAAFVIRRLQAHELAWANARYGEIDFL